MGAAALYHLARRGIRVLGVERFELGHENGSSHGTTRIIRLAYYEHPSYVPLVRRAYALWRELEASVGQKLVHTTGIAEIGPPDGALVSGTLAAARGHDLRHEVLNAKEFMQRFPAFRIPEDYVGVIQPNGGFIAAEAATRAHVQLAIAAGATVRTGEMIRALEPRRNGVSIKTDRGVIDAASAIITAGPWTKKLVPNLRLPLHVTRQVITWLEPKDAHQFAAERFPVFLLESKYGIHLGFPLHAEPGVKLAKHHHRNEIVDPDNYDRVVNGKDEAVIRAAIADHLPTANGPVLSAKTCLYTMTPDNDFIIDQLPNWPHIIIASPCSGHGFKFAAVIGEILAELAATGATSHDISRFRLSRFR